MAGPATIWAIVPAAGIGSRMRVSVPKQYLLFLGQPILARTLMRLGAFPDLTGILVGLSPDDAHWPTLNASKFPKLLGTYAGGATRAETVLNGLKALASRASAEDWVMVHDAVRPCVHPRDLEKLVLAAQSSTDGALLAQPLSDTVKRADGAGAVATTVSRAGLWRALTPQMFRFSSLQSALENAVGKGIEITDESMAVELQGGRPRLVEGRGDNIKITHPNDLALAQTYLELQEKE